MDSTIPPVVKFWNLLSFNTKSNTKTLDHERFRSYSAFCTGNNTNDKGGFEEST